MTTSAIAIGRRRPPRRSIGGYTLQGGDWQGPPLAAMYMAGFTHMKSGFDYPSAAAQAADPNASPQSNAPPAGLRANDNLASQQASVFIAGKLIGNVGSFIQITGDPIGGSAGLDSSDIRYADTLQLFGKDTIWGIDVNNSPTVEDPWNTTPSWGWPQISSTIAPAYGPPLTQIEGSYATTVGGAGVYGFWNDMVYASVIAYKGLPIPALQAFNVGNSTTPAVNNVAPYWRLAIEPHWGSHYLMVGTFGMYGQVVPVAPNDQAVPVRQYGIGTDNYLDVGFDSQYQYDGDQYSVTVKLTDIMEWQRLNATYVLAGSSNLSNSLNSFKANASFVWDHTYSIGFGYFNITGSNDCNAYGSSVAPCMPSGAGAYPSSVVASPNGDGLILDLAYIPFSHGSPSPLPYSTMNARIGVQFTSYLHVYGGTNNFDGSFLGGTHNASGNNSVLAYAWVAF